MPTLREKQKQTIDSYVNLLYHNTVSSQKLDCLPQKLLDYDFGEIATVSFSCYGNFEIDLDFDLTPKYRTLESVASFKKLLGKEFGISFDKVVHLWEENFRHEGELIDDAPPGVRVVVYISYAPKPTTCILTETTETRQVKVYKAVCSETKEEM
jgi:hypothetical protein